LPSSTIEDLLTHRSGIAEGFTSSEAVADAYEHTLPNSTALTPDEFLAALATLPLTYAPGERWLYGLLDRGARSSRRADRGQAFPRPARFSS
jgi:CubicO group peptidase (beta-lactamase class C family)